MVGNGNISVEYLKELVADADAILVRPNAPYPEEVLSAAKKLKVIGVHGVDYGNIDHRLLRQTENPDHNNACSDLQCGRRTDVGVHHEPRASDSVHGPTSAP